MGQKRNFKHYAMIFGFATVAILLFTVASWITEGTLDQALLLSLLILPISFTVLYFLFDKVFDFVFPKRRQWGAQKADGFVLFSNKVNEVIAEKLDLQIEDYRRLQTNERFQKSIRQVYKIMKEGETNELTYSYLQKKFKKDTKEFQALNVFIDEAKKMNENS